MKRLLAALALSLPAVAVAYPVQWHIDARLSLDNGVFIDATGWTELEPTNMQPWNWHQLGFWEIAYLPIYHLEDIFGNLYTTEAVWLEVEVEEEDNPNLFLDHTAEMGGFAISDTKVLNLWARFTMISTGEEPGASVPEPASIALLGLGLAGLVRLRRQQLPNLV